jgi:regulator of replication initiation timing
MQLYIDDQLASIKTKLQQLLKQYQLLQKENQQLKKELEKAKTVSVSKEEDFENLQKQVDGLQLGNKVMDEKEKAALNKRIDGYLKEIEQCLALLNP